MTPTRGLQHHLLTMTRFHRLAYERLLAVLADLPEADYRADRGLYFRSLHGTVNHLHLVDSLWYWRIRGSKPEFRISGLDMEVESDRDALFQQTLERAAAFERLVADLDDADLMSGVSVRTMTGGEMERPAHLLVMTAVNHGTHHRGQICAALTRMGVDYPPLDLPFYEELAAL